MMWHDNTFNLDDIKTWMQAWKPAKGFKMKKYLSSKIQNKYLLKAFVLPLLLMPLHLHAKPVTKPSGLDFVQSSSAEIERSMNFFYQINNAQYEPRADFNPKNNTLRLDFGHSRRTYKAYVIFKTKRHGGPIKKPSTNDFPGANYTASDTFFNWLKISGFGFMTEDRYRVESADARAILSAAAKRNKFSGIYTLPDQSGSVYGLIFDVARPIETPENVKSSLREMSSTVENASAPQPIKESDVNRDEHESAGLTIEEWDKCSEAAASSADPEYGRAGIDTAIDEKCGPRPEKHDMPTNPIAAAINEAPYELVRSDYWSEKFRTITGSHYDQFVDALAMASPVADEGDWVTASGCAQSQCTMRESAFAINKKTGAVLAVYMDSPDITGFGFRYFSEAPEFLQKWVQEKQ